MSREPPLDHAANCLKAFDDGQGPVLRALVYSMLVEIVEMTLFWIASLLSIDERETGRARSGPRDAQMQREK